MQVLVLESSTSAAKALLYERGKGVVAVAGENYGADIGSGGLHDADRLYRLIMRLGGRVAGGRDVAAVAVGGVWHSLVACDRAMRPATPLRLWTHSGAADICRHIRADASRARAIYRGTGCMPNAIYQPYAILDMRRRGLDTADKIFASQSGYLFQRMTGEHLESRNILSGQGFLNVHSLEYDEEALALCGVQAAQLGTPAGYRDVRPLNARSAEALGVASGIPVVPGHADGALNQVGNGAMPAGRMTFSVGTSAAIRLSTDRPVLSDPPATWCYAGVEGWLCGAATNGAGNCLNWFRESLLGGARSFEELDAALLDDARTPVFLPFLFGERCPGWDDERRGGFRDLSGDDDAFTLFRAVSEGILFNIHQCYRILAALSGPPDTVILSGGILNSRKWTQMAADIFRRELLLSDNPHASLLGGAALALCAAGAIARPQDFGDAEPSRIAPRAGVDYEEKFRRYCEYYRQRDTVQGPAAASQGRHRP